VFSQIGVTPSGVNLIRDRFTGQSRGFAFVEVTNDEDADRAVNSLNGQNFGGRNLVVNEARPRQSAAAVVVAARRVRRRTRWPCVAAVGAAVMAVAAGAAEIAATVAIAGRQALQDESESPDFAGAMAFSSRSSRHVCVNRHQSSWHYSHSLVQIVQF